MQKSQGDTNFQGGKKSLYQLSPEIFVEREREEMLGKTMAGGRLIYKLTHI